MQRTPLSKRTRFEVFKRDRFSCQYCGRTPPAVLLEVDHIVPVCEGGIDEETNLVTACFDCNRGKSGTPLDVVPKSLSDKAAEIAEREEQLAGYRSVVQAQLDRIEGDMWQVANALVHNASDDGMRRDWLLSIKGFLKRLPLHEVIEAAEIAYARRPSEYQRFKYFCGVCWNKIRDAED